MQVWSFYKTLAFTYLELNLFYLRYLFLFVYLGNSCTNTENDKINFGNSAFIFYTLKGYLYATIKVIITARKTVFSKTWIIMES